MGEHNPPPYLVRSRRHRDGRRDTYALVPAPSEPGRWLRCHPCVLEVSCPKCGARVLEPCRRKGVTRGQIVRIWHGRAIIIEKSRTRHRSGAHKVRLAAAGRRRPRPIDGEEAARGRQQTLALVEETESV